MVGELVDRRYADPEACVRTIAANRDLLIGKSAGPWSYVGSGRGSAACAPGRGDAAGVPLMVHVTNSPLPLPQVLEQLKSGDVLAHPFHAFTNGIMNSERTAILEPIWDAQKRGVLSELGTRSHGAFQLRRRPQGPRTRIYA